MSSLCACHARMESTQFLSEKNGEKAGATCGSIAIVAIVAIGLEIAMSELAAKHLALEREEQVYQSRGNIGGAQDWA